MKHQGYGSEKAWQLATSFLMGAALAALVWLRIAHFLNVNFDGWSYWEGAIGIANGKGYTDLLGKPIIAFPPLFSSYLSLFASGGTVSLGSVKLALVILAFMNGFAWSWLAQREFNNAQIAIRWLAVSAPVLIFPVYFDMIMSEPLWLLLSAILLWATLHWEPGITSSFAIITLLSLSLLTRNISIAMIPCLPLLVLPKSGLPETKRIAASSLCSLVPWLIYRAIAGSSESHRYGIALEQLPIDLQSSFNAMASDFSHSKSGIAPLALGLLIFSAGYLLLASRKMGNWDQTKSGKAAGWLLFSLTLYLSTALASHLTMVGVGQPRFYLISLLSSIYAILLTASPSKRIVRVAITASVACIFLTSSIYRNGYFIGRRFSMSPEDNSFAPSRNWLKAIHEDVQAKTARGATLEQALMPYGISTLRYKHWMGISYPLQSH